MSILLIPSICYVIIFLVFIFKLDKKFKISSFIINLWLFIALTAHCILLYNTIEIGVGQNLSKINILSMAIWIATIILLLSYLRKPATSLLTTITPIAAIITSLSVSNFNNAVVIKTIESPQNIIHILAATTVLAILILAALQSLQAIIHSYALKKRQTANIIGIKYPLEHTEHSIFRLISIGFIILTILLASLGLMEFKQTKSNVVLIIIGATIFLIFGIMLYQRSKNGLRGLKANLIVLICAIILIGSFVTHQYSV